MMAQEIVAAERALETATLRVDEIFGPVIQGEGVMIGTPTVFVRLGGCPYRCKWCDTLHAVLPEYRHNWEPLEVARIVAKVRDLMPGGGWVTLSGGDPAAQNCWPLIELLHRAGYQVCIETMGLLARDWFSDLDQVTFSPKPPSSGNPTSMADLGKAIAAAKSAPVALKIVVEGGSDLDYLSAAHGAYPAIPVYAQVCNREPGKQGDVADALLAAYRDLIDDVLARGLTRVRVLPQLHVLAYGNRRGV